MIENDLACRVYVFFYIADAQRNYGKMGWLVIALGLGRIRSITVEMEG